MELLHIKIVYIIKIKEGKKDFYSVPLKYYRDLITFPWAILLEFLNCFASMPSLQGIAVPLRQCLSPGLIKPVGRNKQMIEWVEETRQLAPEVLSEAEILFLRAL